MKKLVGLVSLLLVLFSLNLFGQNEERDANFQFKSNNFPVALKQYKALQEKDTTSSIYNYKLAICYLNSNCNPPMALNYLKKVENSLNKESEFQFQLGQAYLYNYQFDQALQAFNSCIVLDGKSQQFADKAKLWITMVENARKLTKSPLDVSFINLEKNMNSEMDETTPIISPDGEFLFYTSNVKYDGKFSLYTSDVYMATLDDGIFKKGKVVPAINSADDEFLAGISMNGERLYAQLQGFEAFEDIFYTNKRGKGFQGKEQLDENINSKSRETAVVETLNGDTLYFASDRPGGFGGLDLYYSLKLPTGQWSVPRNLGESINSVYDEDFPVLSTDGSTLYFCSNGTGSMGGFDVFKSKINPITHEFGKPQNLGYPLNDVFDNKTIAFAPNNRYAYVAAIKPEGFGYSDLYRIIFNQEDPSVKIFMLKFTTDSTPDPKEFASCDTTLKITAYQKSKSVFGTYAYDSKNSQATVALLPGTYTIEVTGKMIEPQTFKISVPDVPGDEKFAKMKVPLTLKK